MQDRKTDINGRGVGRQPKPDPEISVEERLRHTTATLTAHCLITESLVHALCVEQPSISRTRIVNMLDLVYGHLEEGLGGDNDVVKAFADQRDSLRSLLITCFIQAELQMRSELLERVSGANWGAGIPPGWHS